MTEAFGVVVAGAGHNSLVAAAYLAAYGKQHSWTLPRGGSGALPLGSPPQFPAGDGELISPLASGTPYSAERMLRLATDYRAGLVATDDPVLLVLCPTVADPSRAPEGRHTLKILGFQPYEHGSSAMVMLADLGSALVTGLLNHGPIPSD